MTRVNKESQASRKQLIARVQRLYGRSLLPPWDLARRRSPKKAYRA